MLLFFQWFTVFLQLIFRIGNSTLYVYQICNFFSQLATPNPSAASNGYQACNATERRCIGSLRQSPNIRTSAVTWLAGIKRPADTKIAPTVQPIPALFFHHSHIQYCFADSTKDFFLIITFAKYYPFAKMYTSHFPKPIPLGKSVSVRTPHSLKLEKCKKDKILIGQKYKHQNSNTATPIQAGLSALNNPSIGKTKQEI